MISLGWLGTVLIFCGAWGLAHKHRRAFLFYAIGGLCWFLEGVRIWKVDLMVVEGVMLCVAVRNWIKWGKHD